jgi:predicted dehydrogenase
LKTLGYSDISVYRSRPVDIEAIEQGFGVCTFFNLSQALEQHPEVVFVTNPTALHLPTAIEAAEHGCHLFIEKPLSHSLHNTDTLVKLVEARQLTAMVAYNMRFHPALQKLQEMIVQRIVGTILSVRSWAGQYLPDWHPNEDYRQSYVAKADLGGGVVLTLSHEIDYLLWLFGEVEQVVAVTAQAGDLEMSTESLAEIILQFKHGPIAQIHLDCHQRVPNRGCELIGSEGTIYCDLLRSEIQVYRPEANHPETISVPLHDPNQTYLGELTHFFDCVQRGEQPSPSLREGIAVLKIARAAHEASATGKVQICQ